MELLQTRGDRGFPGVRENWGHYYNPNVLCAADVLTAAYYVDVNEIGQTEHMLGACADIDGKFVKTPFSRDIGYAERALRDISPEVNDIYIEVGTSHMSFTTNPRTESLGQVKDDGTMIGQVMHEFRRLTDDRPPKFQDIFNALYKQWGTPENPNIVKYCGAADVTSDYFLGVVEAVKREQKDTQDGKVVQQSILDRKFYNDDLHREITVAQGARAAINWVVNLVTNGPDGKGHKEFILEWQRRNPESLLFQNITDGMLSTMHMDDGELQGILGNYHQPVAHIEVQLSVIEALRAAPLLYPEEGKFFTSLADNVEESTLRLFYMPEQKYFAAAVDHDEKTGNYRQVTTLSLMGAIVLNSSLGDKLPQEVKAHIVQTILGADFMTDIGPVVKAKRYGRIIIDPDNSHANVAEYQGDKNVWPVLVYFAAIKGLHRQGFHNVATQLENRLLNLVHSSSNVEFGFVGNGTVWADDKEIDITGVVAQNSMSKEEFDNLPAEEQAQLLDGKTRIDVQAPYTQRNQLFTAAPILAIKHAREAGHNPITVPNSWQDTVEREIMSSPHWKNFEVLEGEALTQFADNPYFFIFDEHGWSLIEKKLLERSEKIRQQYAGRRTEAA